tara:strand:- start:40 stop:588 length:549 start_codon:yes stop_codon:yes gene_type:complete
MILGENIILSAVEEKHLLKLMEWRNNPEFRKYYREYRVIGYEHQKNWWKSKILNDDTWQYFVVKHKDSPENIIGWVGLTYINWVYRTGEFSITLGDESYRGKGLGKDMLRTILRYGFEDLNLNRIWCEVYDNNKALDLYKKIGFEQEGVLRETVFKNNKYLNSHVLSMLKKDYEKIKLQWKK